MTQESLTQISILLAPSHRDAAAREKVERACIQLGMKVLSIGSTSLCCQVSAKQFKKLFGVLAPQATRGSGALESPSGFTEPAELPVPSMLKDWVESISIEPPAQKMI